MEAQVALTDSGLFAEPSTVFPPDGSRAQAWGLALTLHFLIVALALWGLGPAATAPQPPLVRLVFVEPPPPPPPAAGSAKGTGTLATAATAPAVEKVAAVVEPKRIVAPRKPPLVKAKPAKPSPPQAAVPAVAEAQVQAGSVAGVASGTADGVTGGVTGGIAGGTVGGQGHGPVPAGQVAHPPVLISRVAPQYPRAARLRGTEGLVRLEAILNIEGRIEPDIKILDSLPGLDAAAMAALRQWRFKPARDEQGRSVPVILAVPIHFVMR